MAEIRETEVERDSEGRVIGYRERLRAKSSGGGFGWGLILGAVLIAVGIVAFAYSRGGFETAGREADVVAEATEEQLAETAEEASSVLDETRADVERVESDAALNRDRDPG